MKISKRKINLLNSKIHVKQVSEVPLSSKMHLNDITSTTEFGKSSPIDNKDTVHGLGSEVLHSPRSSDCCITVSSDNSMGIVWFSQYSVASAADISYMRSTVKMSYHILFKFGKRVIYDENTRLMIVVFSINMAAVAIILVEETSCVSTLR